MSGNIHPTAIIEPGAEIAASAVIGAYSYIGGKVRIGEGCNIHHHATVINRTTLGKGNVIHPQSVIGGLPQDLKYHGEDTEVIIGDNNSFREGVTVNIGTKGGGGKTVIGNHCLIMAYCHIAHDCILDDRVVLANCVQLAGHIKVESDAIISGLAAVHHFCTIGRLSFVAGFSGVRQDVPPFMMAEGIPAGIRRLNSVGLGRRNFSRETIDALKQVYRTVYRSNLNRSQAIEKIEAMADIRDIPEVKEVLHSYRESEKGRQGRARESMRSGDFNGAEREEED